MSHGYSPSADGTGFPTTGWNIFMVPTGGDVPWCTQSNMAIAQATHQHNITSSACVFLAFLAVYLMAANRGQWGDCLASVAADKSFTLIGHNHGDRVGRQAAWSTLPGPSTIYQMEVSFKQEFHTLLTMGLLSAAASAPITKCSSFLPSPVALSVCLPLPYFNPSRGYGPVGCWKKRQDLDVQRVSGWWGKCAQGVALFLKGALLV